MSTAPSTFDQYQAGLAPPALKGPNGEAFTSALGLMKDVFAEGAMQALRCRFVSSCPEDALAFIGQERNLPQVPGEPVAAYRARLLNAWQAWQQAGTKPGLINQLNVLGYPNVVVLEDNTSSFALSPPASGFAPGTEWWRFMVFIKPPHPFTIGSKYGDGNTWGNGRLWGIGGPVNALQVIRNTIALWQPAHARMVACGIVLSGGVWGDGGLWGDGRVWGGSVAFI